MQIVYINFDQFAYRKHIVLLSLWRGYSDGFLSTNNSAEKNRNPWQKDCSAIYNRTERNESLISHKINRILSDLDEQALVKKGENGQS